MTIPRSHAPLAPGVLSEPPRTPPGEDVRPRPTEFARSLPPCARWRATRSCRWRRNTAPPWSGPEVPDQPIQLNEVVLRGGVVGMVGYEIDERFAAGRQRRASLGEIGPTLVERRDL
jgi:hypothetical protein